MFLENFLDGPDFDVYGYMPVPNIGRKQRIKITSDDALKIYVQDTRGMKINFGSENRRNPVTPPNADQHARPGGARVTSPLTPPHMNSSEDEDYHQGTKRVPRAKRCIITKELGTPGSKRLHSLHKSPCTPEPEDDDTSPFTPVRKMGYDELVRDNTFKNKQVLEIVLELAKIKERFNWHTVKSNRNRLVVDCKYLSCRWRLRASKMGALSYFIINSIRAPHTCDREKHLIKKQSASRGLAKLFKKFFAQCHSIYTPRQLQYDL
ncbi:hypothetical protein MKW98_019291 [Papaver atlanticum]|uniref:Transposase MuDR plant domain-containing protein n=1 Tax=Papaver atlanticum TaxID=357466 RepID=A0AAD4SB80_9MAGN|nr:hypothetical protein MKW98_019291 [Papaver atlanticum]